jgi:hypothetical protein
MYFEVADLSRFLQLNRMNRWSWARKRRLAWRKSSTSWDSSCTIIYICNSAHLRQSIQRNLPPHTVTKEPIWTAEQHKGDTTAIQYWLGLKPKYLNLSRLAIDVLTIPASSSDFERIFSGTGDILEPQRRKIGA